MQYKLVIVTAPSGAGKTTIVRHLLNVFGTLAFSVSATSRLPRAHEVHGRDYYFLNKEEFVQKIEQGEFVEWEEVYTGRYYGTLISEVERLWGEGKNIVFDIDVKGAVSIQKIYPHNTLSIFVQPPSVEVLHQRLLNRKTETPGSIQKRIERAEIELEYASHFDVIMVNDILEEALRDAEEVVRLFLGKP